MSTSLPGNRTLDSEIVKPIRGVNPISGWNLVVFERVGDGHRFHSVVRDGQPWSPGLSGILRQASFVAYAVRSDADLRDDFTREVSTWNRVGKFTLHCTLTLEVKAPRVVVEQLPQDPLGLLEKMAGDLYHDAASRVDWAIVEQEGPEFWNKILDSESRAADGMVKNRRRIEDFAASRGLQLHHVEIRAIYSEDFGESQRREIQEQAQRRIDAAEAQTRQEKEKATASLVRFQTVQASLCSLIESSGENLKSSLSQIADRVTTPADLQRIIGQLLDVCGNVGRLVEAREESSVSPSLRQRVLALLPEAPAGALHPAMQQVGKIAALVAELQCSQREKNQLLGAAFHRVGDLVLDEAADAAAVERHRELLREAFDAVQPHLETQHQHEVVANLVNLRALAVDAGR